MSLGTMDEAEYDTFNRICASVSSRGKGLRLTDLTAAAGLALALEDGDQEKAQIFADRLDLEPGTLITEEEE